MSTKAMKLALDHLINLQPILGNGLFEERQLAFIDPHIDCAITALQEALAQPQQEPVPAAMKTVIEAMQVDPEYAWSWHCNIAMAFVDAGGDHYTGNQGAARFMKMLANVQPAHELPSPPAQPQQEPVAKIKRVDEYGPMLDWYTHWTDFPVGTKLYTTPSQRKPLTEGEIESMWIGSVGFLNPMLNQHTRLAFARAIEAKHGIKGDA